MTRRALQLAQSGEQSRFVEIHSLFNQSEAAALVIDPSLSDAIDEPLHRVTGLPSDAGDWSPLQRMMYYRLKHILPEDMLVKVDRMSMSCSLEIRAPFLDIDLATVAMSLPDRFLIHGKEQKYVLRRLARKHLPSAVFDRPKTGFSIPLHHFQNREYQALAAELLECRHGPMSLFSAQDLVKIRTTALERNRDMADTSLYRVSHQLWALMQLAAWGERFGIVA
jgi:asparagine synthase (glutamine-hydrolysing)